MAAESKIPLISVVVPVFNNAKVVAQTLASLQAQTFCDFEAIIVDDGSTDGTADVVCNCCQGDSRFLLLQQKNSGVSGARNRGIQSARGEWIAFLDGDDIWFPEKLARQMELSRQEPRANFLFTNYSRWDGQRDFEIGYPPDQPIPSGDVLERLIWNFSFLPSTVMVRSKLLREVGAFDTGLKFAEDWDLWLRLAIRGMYACGTTECLVRYRRWHGSITVKDELNPLAANADVVKKHFQTVIAQRPELRIQYINSINRLENTRDMTHARLAITDIEELSRLAWKRWRRERHWKSLRSYVFLNWPSPLGGNATRNYVRKRIAMPATHL